MISIIICSKQQDIPESLKANIKNTVGVPYELIVIDNSKNKYSIFEAYNEGIKKAVYEYLCFMHEDIWYHSQNWGKSVIRHLSDPKTGLVGLAGSYYLLAFPSSWFYAEPHCRNLIQNYPSQSEEKITKRHTIPEDKNTICVDGFWFCSRKAIFEEVSFDTTSYHGFHFYDMDISMQIHRKGYLIYAISDIAVEHYSTGNQDAQWLQTAYIFYNKWKDYLPDTVDPDYKPNRRNNIKVFRNLLYIHKVTQYPLSKETWKIGWKQLKFNVLTAYFLYIISCIRYLNK